MCYKKIINYTSCREDHGGVETVLCTERCGKVEAEAYQTIKGYCKYCDIAQFWLFTDSPESSTAEADDDEHETGKGKSDDAEEIHDEDLFLDLAESLLQPSDQTPQRLYAQGGVIFSVGDSEDDNITFDSTLSFSDESGRESSKSSSLHDRKERTAAILAWQKEVAQSISPSSLRPPSDFESVSSNGSSIQTQDMHEDFEVLHDPGRRLDRQRSSNRPPRHVHWAGKDDEMGIGGISEVPSAYMSNLTGRPSNRKSRLAAGRPKSILKASPDPVSPTTSSRLDEEALTVPLSSPRADLSRTSPISSTRLPGSSAQQQHLPTNVSGYDSEGNPNVLPSGIYLKLDDVDKLRVLDANFAAQDAEASANLRARFTDFIKRRRTSKDK